MADYGEMADNPIEIEIAGRKLKARRPNLNAVFGEIESNILSKAIERINQASKTFGLEGDEKIKFLRESMTELPQGVNLQKQIQEKLSTAEGTTVLLRHVLKKDQPELSDDEIIQIVLADPEMTGEWMAYLTGDRKKKPEVKGVIPTK